MLQALLLHIPSFELAWLFFSILIALFFLLRIEGATQAIWLLPLIVLAYSIDNRLNGVIPLPSPDLTLFPTEAIIMHDYVGEPLHFHWIEQQQQLQQGWNSYLVKNWTSALFNQSQPEWEKQVEEGEFNFTVARLQRFHNQPQKSWSSAFNEKVSYFLLTAYFLWNSFFAWAINRKERNL